VKAVWDMDKVYRETTPTRERVCINGLWRWQPADEKKLDQPPTDNWGFFKVPGAWPELKVHQWMAEESQRLYRHPSWKDRKVSTVDMAWYEREFTVPREWTGRRMTLRRCCETPSWLRPAASAQVCVGLHRRCCAPASPASASLSSALSLGLGPAERVPQQRLSVEWLRSYARVFIDGKKVGETYYPGGEVDITSACKPGDKRVLSVLTVTVPRGQRIADYLATEPAKREGVGSFRGLCGDVFLCSTPAAGNQLSNLSASPETTEGFIRLEPLYGV
jgi:hypothetical protein